MLHLQPVRESQASGSIAELYQDIQLMLGTQTVPVYFQYIANYPEVLDLLWKEIKPNFQTEKFKEATEMVTRNALKTVIEVYHPLNDLMQYISHMRVEEKEEKIEEALRLLQTQAKMLLIEIQIREAIKGMPIMGSKTQGYLESPDEKEEVDTQSKAVITNQALAISTQSEFEYDSFFERIEHEMKQLVTQKNYLESRVDFEKKTLFMLLQGAFPLEISYAEFRELLIGKSYIPEFLFLLKDVFPSNAPRQLFTAALMNYVLNLD